MDDEFKDRRLKYVDLPNVFHARASEISITSKQHLRVCEKMANHLSKQRPSNPKDFERNEWLKDFVIKSAELNERTIQLLDFLREQIADIAIDAKVLMDGGKTLDVIRDQDDAIRTAWYLRDEAIKAIYELKQQSFRENQATA